MKTRRLYYEDAYQQKFRAEVIAVKPGWVALDQTCFYPEGGGQPADHGWLAGSPVVDTQAEGQLIWHQTEAQLAVGDQVEGEIDWARRFDLMQQHTGQHVLSESAWTLFQATTIGFHLSEASVTIDLDLPELTAEQWAAMETLANDTIGRQLPVTASFVTAQDLPQEQMRKLPKVTEGIRLVHIHGFDLCPCGGTHLSDLGQVRLLRILNVERRKGNVRVYFVCGQRALDDYLQKHQTVSSLSALLSEPPEAVLDGALRWQERIMELERENKELRSALLQVEADELWAAARPIGEARLVTREFTDRSLDELRTLAGILSTQYPGALVFGLAGTPYRLLVNISEQLAPHAGQLLKSGLARFAGKGGGNAFAAQGAVEETAGAAALQHLGQLLEAELSR